MEEIGKDYKKLPEGPLRKAFEEAAKKLEEKNEN